MASAAMAAGGSRPGSDSPDVCWARACLVAAPRESTRARARERKQQTGETTMSNEMVAELLGTTPKQVKQESVDFESAVD